MNYLRRNVARSQSKVGSVEIGITIFHQIIYYDHPAIKDTPIMGWRGILSFRKHPHHLRNPQLVPGSGFPAGVARKACSYRDLPLYPFSFASSSFLPAGGWRIY